MAKKNNGARKPADLEASLQESFIQKNIKKIAIICGAVVAVVLVCIVVNSVVDSRNAKAAEALAPCEQLFVAGSYDKALEGDGVDCAGLLAVADQYGCTKSGNLAKLYAGLAYAQLGKAEEAREWLEKFSSKGDAMVSPAAMGALGNTYVQLGENEKGAATLVKAAKKADNNVLSPIFLIQAGEVYEAMGQADKALPLYELVKSKYRASQQGQEIEKYIQRAKLTK